MWGFVEKVVEGVVFLSQNQIQSVFLGLDTVMLTARQPTVLDHLLCAYQHPYFTVF